MHPLPGHRVAVRDPGLEILLPSQPVPTSAQARPLRAWLAQLWPRLSLLAVLSLLLLCGAPTASANPDLKFRTITTEHFVIHYHTGQEEVADRVAMLSERAYERLTLGLGHAPSLRTHIVLTDSTDASVRVRLHMVVPS